MNMILSDPDLVKAFEGGRSVDSSSSSSSSSSGFSPLCAVVFERLPAFFLSDMHIKICRSNTEFYHLEDDRLVIRDKSKVVAVRSYLSNDYILLRSHLSNDYILQWQ